MEKLSLILSLIGVSVFVFSLWSFLLVRRHLKKFKSNFKHVSSLTDEKFFELKARQEYIIAISAIIFAIISFIGYTSIDNIKNDINLRLKAEVDKMDSLNKRANDNYGGLELRGRTYEDSVENAFQMLTVLNRKMKQLLNKDVITQNIFIVDPLRIGDFPTAKSDFYSEGIRVIYFKNLRTVSGKSLPIFKERPSVICLASTLGSIKINEIFTDRFTVALESYAPKNSADKGDNLTFTAWISQRPARSFDESFNDDFQ